MSGKENTSNKPVDIGISVINFADMTADYFDRGRRDIFL